MRIYYYPPPPNLNSILFSSLLFSSLLFSFALMYTAAHSSLIAFKLTLEIRRCCAHGWRRLYGGHARLSGTHEEVLRIGVGGQPRDPLPHGLLLPVDHQRRSPNASVAVDRCLHFLPRLDPISFLFTPNTHRSGQRAHRHVAHARNTQH